MIDYPIITVGFKNADITGSTNEEIQAAIDRISQLGGGEVHILPGTYIMHDSLHLRTNVKVKGSGNTTVLLKPASVTSPVIYYLGYGHYDVSVAHPEKFRPGMGVYITDNNSSGFYGTVATINWKSGNTLGLTKMLNHDIAPWENGRAISVYPVISGYNLENSCIENLVIDGNSTENDYINGCRGGGIFLLQAHNISMANIVIKNYNGDGISFQQCSNILIENCECRENTGHGIHPGSGSVGTILRNTTSADNGGDGIYYCLRVSYSICEGCIITGNGNNGISIGHRDNDLVIKNNTISKNHSDGIFLRNDPSGCSGVRNLITQNILDNNCVEKGTGEITLNSSAHQFHITKNTFRLGNAKGLAKGAICVNSPPKSLAVWDNIVENGNSIFLTEDTYNKGIIYEKPLKTISINLDSITGDAYKHLGI